MGKIAIVLAIGLVEQGNDGIISHYADRLCGLCVLFDEKEMGRLEFKEMDVFDAGNSLIGFYLFGLYAPQ